MPGDNVSCEVTLITPVALEKGLRFRFAKAATQSAQAPSRRLLSSCAFAALVTKRSRKEFRPAGNYYVAVRGLQEP